LKEKLNVFAEAEIDVQRKKLEDFNKTQADLISARLCKKLPIILHITSNKRLILAKKAWN